MLAIEPLNTSYDEEEVIRAISHALNEFYMSLTKTLDDMRSYDPDLYRIARWGRFGLNGLRVLPQFEVAETHEEVMNIVYGTPQRFLFNGFDFGFETSYNAIVRMAVDNERK